MIKNGRERRLTTIRREFVSPISVFTQGVIPVKGMIHPLTGPLLTASNGSGLGDKDECFGCGLFFAEARTAIWLSPRD